MIHQKNIYLPIIYHFYNNTIMKRAIVFLLALCVSVQAFSKVYNVRDFGAKGGGVTIDSPAINAAIAAAA